MRRLRERLLSVGLIITLTLSYLTISYGATPSGSGGGNQYNPGNWPAYGKNPTPYGDHWGVRITVTNMSQAGEAGIAPVELGDNYTAAINQFNDLAAILKTKVWWF